MKTICVCDCDVCEIELVQLDNGNEKFACEKCDTELDADEVFQDKWDLLYSE
jgi:hypothetical protein